MRYFEITYIAADGEVRRAREWGEDEAAADLKAREKNCGGSDDIVETVAVCEACPPGGSDEPGSPYYRGSDFS